MAESDNITKLKHLVNRLEIAPFPSDDYSNILNKIKEIINEEEKIINEIQENDIKIIRYKNLCENIKKIISNNDFFSLELV